MNGIEQRHSIPTVDLFGHGELEVSEIVIGPSYPISSALR